MGDLIDEAVLYVLRCGASAYRTDPEMLEGPDARGIRQKIKRLSKRLENDPLELIRLWNRHEERLEGLAMVKNWYAFKNFHLDDDDDDFD